MQSAHGWNEAEAFAARACIPPGSTSFRNGGANLHAASKKRASPASTGAAPGRSRRFANLYIQFFEGSEEQGAVLAQICFRLFGWIFGNSLGDQHNAAIRPGARRKSDQLRWNFFLLQNVDLAIGKIDEADPILANHQIRILPSGHVAEVR